MKLRNLLATPGHFQSTILVPHLWESPVRPRRSTPPPKPQKRETDGCPPAATEVKIVRVPDRGIQPQAAVDTEGTLHFIYLGDEPGAANVYYVQQACRQRKVFKTGCRSTASREAPSPSVRFAGRIWRWEGQPRPCRLERVGNGRAEGRGVKYGNPMLYYATR